ncbi:MAG: hypothetical protein PHS93_09560, partial [Candidatus Omnitrophica bacterium]|nr:hypothetical protein [Candidatus Omnitrophota bacterium]
RIGKLEFQADNLPRYKIGDLFGDWKVNNIFVDGSCQRSLFYMIGDAPYLLKYKCINCRDNAIKDFTEKELSELK